MKNAGGVVLLFVGVVFVIGAIKGTWKDIFDAALGKGGSGGGGGGATPGPEGPGAPAPGSGTGPQNALAPGWPGSGVTS